jgi:hypothetical protein
METIDYRQQLLEEIEGLSDRELEKIYKIVTPPPGVSERGRRSSPIYGLLDSGRA